VHPQDLLVGVSKSGRTVRPKYRYCEEFVDISIAANHRRKELRGDLKLWESWGAQFVRQSAPVSAASASVPMRLQDR
jgi:hypothetical protein